jgi:Ca-activated chloride channel family protein
LLLRESEYRGDATYDAVRIAAREALGTDPDGRRAEFLALVDAADQLSAARKLLRREAKAS